MTVEDLIRNTVQAARAKSSQAEGYYDAFSKMAVDSEAPPPLQALAGVMRRVLTGNFDPDLSGLPPELAEVVKQALEENR